MPMRRNAPSTGLRPHRPAPASWSVRSFTSTANWRTWPPVRPGVDDAEAATLAEWIATLFAGHVAKVNDLLLPALTSSGADLAALLADMHEPQAGAQG